MYNKKHIPILKLIYTYYYAILILIRTIIFIPKNLIS